MLSLSTVSLISPYLFVSFEVVEVSRRQNRVRESPGNGDMISKLEAAEYKLEELKSSMVGLGKEAIAAMSAVEAQQQRLTLQRLIALVIINGAPGATFSYPSGCCVFMVTDHSCFYLKVEAERAYHQRVLEILDQLEEEVYMLSALLFEQIYILVCCVGTVSVNSKARRIFYLLV